MIHTGVDVLWTRRRFKKYSFGSWGPRTRRKRGTARAGKSDDSSKSFKMNTFLSNHFSTRSKYMFPGIISHTFGQIKLKRIWNWKRSALFLVFLKCFSVSPFFVSFSIRSCFHTCFTLSSVFHALWTRNSFRYCRSSHETESGTCRKFKTI